MKKYLGLLLLTAFCWLLTGCAPALWNGSSIHPVRLGEQTTNYRIPFRKGRVQASEKVMTNLLAYVNQTRDIQSLTLVVPTGNLQYLSKARAAYVQDYLSRYKLKSTVKKQSFESKHCSPRNCLLLVMNVKGVIVPHCPDNSHPNATYGRIQSNFGCSMAQNFGMMIDNPNDLVADQKAPLAQPGDDANKAIMRYRKSTYDSMLKAVTPPVSTSNYGTNSS